MRSGTTQEAREVAWNQTLMTRAGSRPPISRMVMKAPAQNRADRMPNRVPFARGAEKLQSWCQSEGEGFNCGASVHTACMQVPIIRPRSHQGESPCRVSKPLLSVALQLLSQLPHHEPLVVPGIPVSKDEGRMSLDDQTCQRHQHPG